MAGPTIDSMALAQRCRKLIRERYALVTSCIETSFLVEQTALSLGLPIKRMVCQVQAFSPKVAEAMERGEPIEPLLGQPGCWAVAVGMLQHPGDFVGRLDDANNRYVGHVVCIAGDHLIDASADQLSRPQWDLNIPNPVIGPIPGEGGPQKALWFSNAEGVLLGYWFHPEVPLPKPVTDKKLKRLARQLALELTPR